MKDVTELLRQMMAVCPVECRVSVSITPGDLEDSLILRWDWKSYHYQCSYTSYDRIAGVCWNRELDIVSHEIREFIKQTYKPKESEETNGKNTNPSDS